MADTDGRHGDVTRSRIRRQVEGLEARRENPGDPAAVPARYCGQVYSGGALPTTVPSTYLTRPVTRFDFPEKEGGAVSVVVDSGRSVPVVCIGPKVPTVGDVLNARKVNARWVADYGESAGGDPGHILPSCTCVVPSSPVVAAPFDGTGRYDWIREGPLTWQARPADLGLAAVDNPGYFSDPYDVHDFFLGGGVVHRVRLWYTCVTSQYRLVAVTTNDDPGGPSLRSFIVCGSFNINSPPTFNTCSPYRMNRSAAASVPPGYSNLTLAVTA